MPVSEPALYQSYMLRAASAKSQYSFQGRLTSPSLRQLSSRCFKCLPYCLSTVVLRAESAHLF